MKKNEIITDILDNSNIHHNVHTDYNKIPQYKGDYEEVQTRYESIDYLAGDLINMFKEDFEDYKQTPLNDSGNRNLSPNCEIKGKIYTYGRMGATLYWDKYWQGENSGFGFIYDQDDLEEMTMDELKVILKDITEYNKMVDDLMTSYYVNLQDKLDTIIIDIEEENKQEKLYQETFSNKDKQYVKMLMKSTGFDQMAKEVDTASEAQLKKMVSNAISSMEKRVKNLPVEKGEPMLKKLKFLKQQGKKLKLIEAVFKEARKYRVGDKVKFVDADWKKTYPNIYEVNYVNPNGGLKLKDLKTGKRLPYTFNDSSVKSESLIESFSEVIKVSGNWKLVRKSKSKPFMFYYENKSNNQHITISFDEKKKEYFVFASKQKAQFFKILKDAEKNAESYMNKNKESFKLESLHKKMFTKKSKLTILHEAFKLKESKKRYKTTSGVLVDIYENEGEYSIGTVNVNGDIAHFPDKYKSETDAKKVANEVILSMKKKVKTK